MGYRRKRERPLTNSKRRCINTKLTILVYGTMASRLFVFDQRTFDKG